MGKGGAGEMKKKDSYSFKEGRNLVIREPIKDEGISRAALLMLLGRGGGKDNTVVSLH